MVLHAGTLGHAKSAESDCTNWDLGSTIALPSSSTNFHYSPAQKRSLHTIKAVPDPSHERSILRTQMVVFGETETTQRDGVERNRCNNIDVRLQERLRGGGSFLGERTGGRWQEKEGAHINVLELKAAYLAIQAFVKGTMNPRHIQVLMDNSTAVSYINKREGTHSPTLASLALEIWNYCISRKIWITARHVPGVTNIEADFASRNFNDRTEWALNKMVFQRITKRFYTPEVNLFAPRLNNQLPRYVARYPNPGSIATDAFLQHWRQWKVFIHGSIVLLPRILQKLQQDQATGLVIAPTWPGQPWFPALRELLVDFPAQLPIAQGTIFLPFEQQTIHPLWKTLRLAVWPLSGLVCKQQAFYQRCAKFCWPLGEQALRRDTKDPGSSGLAGVCKGINVPFQPL